MTKKARKPFERINFALNDIGPITEAQSLAFKSDRNLMLHGAAGTGKTFISLYLACKDLYAGLYENIIIIRSAVPTRDIGFLPGTEQEKARVYEVAYSQIFSDLFSRGDAYSTLKEKNIVKFMTTSFIRSITLDNCVVVVDECQNMNFHELDSVITRVGENCRIIFSGDYLQSDLKKQDKQGIKDFISIIDSMDSFDFIEFGIEDIVRSDLVKEYLTIKYNIL